MDRLSVRRTHLRRLSLRHIPLRQSHPHRPFHKHDLSSDPQTKQQRPSTPHQNNPNMQTCPQCHATLNYHLTEKDDPSVEPEERASVHHYNCGTNVLTLLQSGKATTKISQQCTINALHNAIQKLHPIPQPIQNIIDEAQQWILDAQQPGVVPSTTIKALADSIVSWNEALHTTSYRHQQPPSTTPAWAREEYTTATSSSQKPTPII